MSPMSEGGLGGSTSDTYQIMQTLQNRFGISTQQELMQSYENTWITPTDLDNIKSAGFNLIRIPVWWGQFYDLNNTANSGWRKDAFIQLDKLVNAAAARKIYVIIDMHGAIGSQSLEQSTGQINKNEYWNSTVAHSRTAWMWWQIANHYKNNAYIAGYDLLNEPDSRPNKKIPWNNDYYNQIIHAYDQLYHSVRQADPNHIVFIEATFGTWSWNMLPDPKKMNWNNVVYETHLYPWSSNPQKVVNHTINDFIAHKSWNIPGYVGEFNLLNSDSASWSYAINSLNSVGLNWSIWSYKSSNSPAPNYWGWYVRQQWPGQPNIVEDSPDSIRKKWGYWKTINVFQKNVTLGIKP
ncbi:glycoside hydrolase family 5 protein [Acinetobacter nectaris]|uniref:glycoside hydrolase family 5 protein n=1 Tax=Acinetobacter nectaris TaxID=1219382 RepID=UPI001F241A62|nr:cellulase family glycosylhydrolase [Acinetobacter nectaris]MCF9047543.1 cellulase family glycosylhydrolase [Acinetobacter nectaris]